MTGCPGERREQVASVYRRHASGLRRVLRARSSRGPEYTGSLQHGNVGAFWIQQDVDDLVHDVFARLLTSNGGAGLDKGRDPVPYLVSIARNLHVDGLRRRRGFTPPSDEPIVVLEEEERLRDRRLEVEIVAAYARRLSPELADLYEARFERGMSQRDAAALLGVSRRQVRTLERRLLDGALRELRNSWLVTARRRGRSGSCG
jgi:RNA polymerase sigma factor (sigma-70 family)